VWPPDVIYIKLLLNLLLIGLGVWLVVWWFEESIEGSRNLVALFVTGAIFVVGGVGFPWLIGDTNTRRYLLLIEIGIDGQLIVMGYALLVAGLIGLGKKKLRSFSDDA
jgi:hypothetical protein